MTLPVLINLIWKDKEQVVDACLEETTTRTRLTICCQTAIKTRLSTIVFRREDREALFDHYLTITIDDEAALILR